jgi:hypothetical protein
MVGCGRTRRSRSRGSDAAITGVAGWRYTGGVELRSPIVVLLVLLLTMLPLGSLACDVHCGVTASSGQLSLKSQACVEHDCCDTSHAVLCTSPQAQGAMGTVAAGSSELLAGQSVEAVATGSADIATQESAARPGHDSSPPGLESARTQTPLRI